MRQVPFLHRKPQPRRAILSVAGGLAVFCIGLVVIPDSAPGGINWHVAGAALAGLIAGFLIHRLLSAPERGAPR